MDALYRPVGRVARIIDKHRVPSIVNEIIFLRHDHTLEHLASLQRVAPEKQLKQDHCQRIPVCEHSRFGNPPHDFRRHEARHAADTEIIAVRRHVITIAYQHVAGPCVNKKSSVIEVLITLTRKMQGTEGFDNVDRRRDHHIQRSKPYLSLDGRSSLTAGFSHL